MIKVENFSSKKGNKVPNQFIIEDERGTYFQSYNTIIIFVSNKQEVYLDRYNWNYSRTTAKYRNMFLNETKQETERKIKTGEYKLVNLNV